MIMMNSHLQSKQSKPHIYTNFPYLISPQQLSNMSKRLDSLNRTSTPSGTPTSAKPALKFKPKAVSRKTKEERESAGKINTPGVNKIAEKNNKKLGAKKPGVNGNNARNNKKLSGTQLVVSGPLSEGTISLGGSGGNGATRAGMRGPSNPLLERLKSQAMAKDIRKNKIKAENGHDVKMNKLLDGEDYDSDSEEDDNAIDMSKRAIIDEDLLDDGGDMDLHKIDTALFPVRAERHEHREYGEDTKIDKTIKTEFHNERSMVPSETPSTSREGTASLTPGPTSTSDTNGIINTLTDGTDPNSHINNYQEQAEIKQLNNDYNILSKSLKSLDMGNNMFFMQFPCSLPILEGGINGQIGKIRIHKSGKMTMKIGKVKFEVLRGGSSDFMQDIVLVDKEQGNCYHVGNIKEKITAIPKIL